eukprot:TRINITY_DN12799_c0_g1_i1.p1 TRINITY_DN12799_c0_g1~~TRINITY_DN12799_c0_g1_i1.p1  ORF type:complete len:164 (+),score=29.32 TRINITY_DN12799_c0_g1_i1:40-531(+)
MATEIEGQTERAFQKQPTVFVGRKKVLNKKVKSRDLRFTRNVGLGIKTPATARRGTYIDKKCPFTGDISIRGRILRGIVVSTKMRRTIVVRRDYLHFVSKYNRFEKRHSNITAHLSPAIVANEGDIVTIGQCRPLSKTIRFNVLDSTPQDFTGLQKKKQFRIF